MRTQTDYNKIVNFDKETNEIIMLDYIFNSNDGFKGATGTIFEPISKEQYFETIEPYLNEPMELLKYYSEQGFEINSDMIDSIDEACTEDELKSLFFDLSYIELWDTMRKELKLSENEAYIFNCIGGGRCFDKDFKGNVNVKLSKLIREIES